MTRTLVTGGSGFLGAALVSRLVFSGQQVRVLDNNSRGEARRLDIVSDEIEFIEADIRDSDTVAAACENVDRVVHLAAINGTENFYTQPEHVLDVGVRGILNVVEACREHDVRTLVVASSSEVYQTPPTVPTDESVPLAVPDVHNPRYSYGGSKILTELITINYGRFYFDRAVIFRPHNVYGPDMGWEHVIPQFALRAAELAESRPTGRLPFQIQGNGRQTRAFVHIDDFIDGLMLVMNLGEHLGVYNIGTMEEVSIGELARQVVACHGREVNILPSAEPEGATPRRCPDIAKLLGLGYRPEVALSTGLPDVVRWYAENRYLRPGRH